MLQQSLKEGLFWLKHGSYVIKYCISVKNFEGFGYSYLLCTIHIVVQFSKLVIAQYPPSTTPILAKFSVCFQLQRSIPCISKKY